MMRTNKVTSRDLDRVKRAEKAARQRLEEEVDRRYSSFPLHYEQIELDYPYDVEVFLSEPVISHDTDPELMAYVDEILGEEK